MTRYFVLIAPALVLAGCAQEPELAAPDRPTATADIAADTVAKDDATRAMPRTSAGMTFPFGTWDMVSSGEGDGLFFAVTEGEPATIHLFCPSDGGLLVNVNAFRPIGSEERMTFGSGATVVTLVADPSGDTMRGGVSGEGPVPVELSAILTGADGVAVNYGAQTVGPLPPVSAAIARDFVTGCND